MPAAVPSLQSLCCTTISMHCELYSESDLNDLTEPSLELLAPHLCMYDLLRLEKLLEKRRISVKTSLDNLHKQIFKFMETYPISATTCPHLIDLFPCDGQDWGLSRLLYRRVFAYLITEYQKADGCVFPNWRSADFDSETQRAAVLGSEPLMQLFTPPCYRNQEEVMKKLERLDFMVDKLGILAGKKILFMTVDLGTLDFFSEPESEPFLSSCLESVKVVSLLLKSSLKLLEFVGQLKRSAKRLERVCIYGIKKSDLQFMDAILSVCSGVQCFYKTSEGQREWQALYASIRDMGEGHCLSSQDSARVHDAAMAMTTKPSAEFDLMDDALLFSNPCPPCEFDSSAGLQKVDLRFTNLLKLENYVFVMNHHLRSWLALQELHLGVPDLHPETVRCLCLVLQRPQFKSFTLSTTTVTSFIMEDLLCAVAARRNSEPLDKLMFVSLQENMSAVSDILITDQLMVKSPEELKEYVRSNESKKLSQYTAFEGTKLIEFSSCLFSPVTECIIAQYFNLDHAMTSLCLSNSISRFMVQTILTSLSETTSKDRAIERLLLEYWHIVAPAHADALIAVLQKNATSLRSLSLKGCIMNASKYQDIIEAIADCMDLKQLDLSENQLGSTLLKTVPTIISSTAVSELSLKKNNMLSEDVVKLLQSLEDLTSARERPLDILDLRGNQFMRRDQAVHADLIHEVTKFVYLESGS